MIEGKSVDCNTNNPIADVQISTNQSGWGFSNGQLVWDKDYITTAQSDASGLFKLSYKVGDSADIKARKEGYITAEQFESPATGIV